MLVQLGRQFIHLPTHIRSGGPKLLPRLLLPGPSLVRVPLEGLDVLHGLVVEGDRVVDLILPAAG